MIGSGESFIVPDHVKETVRVRAHHFTITEKGKIMTDWIDLKDRLPDIGETIMVLTLSNSQIRYGQVAKIDRNNIVLISRNMAHRSNVPVDQYGAFWFKAPEMDKLNLLIEEQKLTAIKTRIEQMKKEKV